MSAVIAYHEVTDRDQRLIEWFAKWRKPIRSWLRNRASVPPSEIDDLAQEVFLRLLRYSDDVAVESPAAYLFRIASNVANEWRERCRVRLPHDAAWLEPLLIEDEHEPENVVALEQFDKYMYAVIGELRPRQREILALHIQHGMTYKQIAQVRGLTHRVVVRDLSRAYGTLRMRLRAEDWH